MALPYFLVACMGCVLIEQMHTVLGFDWGIRSLCTNYRTGDASFHHAPVCSTRLLYGDAGSATVTAAVESSPPDRIRTDLLQWLTFISPSSLVVCHSHHTSAVWLRRAKTVDNVT